MLKYTTGIDLENPTSYFESQIPLIAYMNLPSLIASQDSPIVVIPNNETTSDKETNSNVDNLPKENESITVINPNDKDVPKKKLDKSKPLVLIFHTHTTESYNPRNEKDRNFTTDYSQNVVKVGEEIKKELEEKYGIAVIHDITIHDLPTREKGYEKSRPTVESYIKKYPSLKLIIDLHRDASDSVSKTTAIINNERYARPMFVVGAKNKNYKSNAEKVIKINDILNSMYPNFSRGILYKNARYNQDLSSKMILLEIGCNLNSLEEAIRTGKIMAKVIAIYLK
ncbi:stage II sporulation protein P [Thermobrachium celere]|uniref:stage II sporulation protein P n=1 Tax=Thermobrachium celere TaxID=53422 RepID=UPI0004109D4A|nr:stage II sporulation protein P [Thermobrachium celere]GFR34526.1 stage II sporulation protein P [Thermobrachium celere]